MRLPPMNALRAFEAVARHASFKHAADELSVTPAAISHQIKVLEDFLGTPLFDRKSRALELTPAGSRCYPGIHAGFEAIRSALARAALVEPQSKLLITAGPAFVGRWLAPRLHEFVALNPDVDTRIDASLSFSSFEADEVDVAIRFGDPRRIENLDRGELSVERLVEDSVLPLCSPDVLARAGLDEGPQGLASVPLIHDGSLSKIDPQAPGWADWLAAAGVRDVDATRGLRFEIADHALQAACDGAGIVLGRRVLATPDMERGRLVTPFGPELRTGLWFHLVCRLAGRDSPPVAAFRTWVRDLLS
ncbi:transcriptional regulator GcvA [Salinarimonas ramus]|uniref:LysR family transcriptional regulator n=1 Tax=Salinarimonas ramus TaxID=690164 RepID=A0A917V448_9HYPH|nr:transcriptional regulator GcvA [Salinarimonas ramus]GGK37008.1 LysR family transcriptional regulator [Salinarimonas ramus]